MASRQGSASSNKSSAAAAPDQQTTDWIKVWKLVQKPWTADVPPPAALSAASEANNCGATRTCTRRLTDALLTQRLSLSGGGGGGGSAGAGTSSAAAATVFEIVLDNMQLCDLGDASGGGMSPIALYPNLRLLSANFNGIKSVTVGCVTCGLAELREVQLDYNELGALPLFDNPKLESISAGSNKVPSLPALALPKLTTLVCSHNAITHLDPKARLPALTHLDLSHNSIVTLDSFAELVHVSYLNVSHNQLTTLNGIQGMLALEELVASHNRLRHVPTLQHSNPLRAVGKALTALDVSFNEISSLGFFPTGALVKVNDLNIARNSFHGKKAPETPTAGGTGGAGARGSRQSQRDIFASSDIGDASYDDDTAPAAPGGKKQPQQQRGSRAADTPASAVSSGSTAARRSSSSSMSNNARRPSATEADTVTFLARLVTLFPELEVLDVSHNSDDLISDYSDLRVLAKCANLTELKIEGTLSLPKSNRNRKAEAVAMFLPQIHVLDGEPLVKAAAPIVEDVGEIPLLANSSRPGTATARPGSALTRPATSSKAKSTAIQASKIDREDVAESVLGFIQEAEMAREKCYAYLDHIAQNAAWVYGKGEEPPEVEALIKLRMASLTPAATSGGGGKPDVLRPQQLRGRDADDAADSDLDEAGAPSSARSGASATPPAVKNPTTPRLKRGASSSSGGSEADKGASPHSKLRSYQGVQGPPVSSATKLRSSSAASSLSSQSTPPVGGAPAARTASTHATTTGAGGRTTTTGSNTGSSVAATASSGPSNAMVRVRSEPSGNFNLEQARFKQEMDREAAERRQQLINLTKGAAAPMPVKSLSASHLYATPTKKQLTGSATAGSKTKCESGTSTTSPSHPTTGRAAGAAQQQPMGSRPASSLGGVRVSASTATSPAKGSLPQGTAGQPPPQQQQLRIEASSAPKPATPAATTTTTTTSSSSTGTGNPQQQQLAVTGGGAQVVVPPLALARLPTPQEQRGAEGPEEPFMAPEDITGGPKDSQVVAADPRRRGGATDSASAKDTPLPQAAAAAAAVVSSSRQQRLGSTATPDTAPRPNSAQPQKVRVTRPDLAAAGLLKVKPLPSSAAQQLQLADDKENASSKDGTGDTSSRTAGGAKASSGGAGKPASSVKQLLLDGEGAMDEREDRRAVEPSASGSNWAPPSSAAKADTDASGAEGVPTFYSTAAKPVQMETVKVQAAGTSLNNRRRK